MLKDFSFGRETRWLRRCHHPAGEDGMEPGANLTELTEARLSDDARGFQFRPP
jgi:hypothetical protein